jgi:hypothetical protein
MARHFEAFQQAAADVGNDDSTSWCLENAIRWNLRRRDNERARNNYDAADHFEANARQLRQRLCKGA